VARSQRRRANRRRYKREDLEEEETERDERKLEKTTTTKTRASGLPANIVYVMVIGIVAVVAQAGATPVAAESIGAAVAQQNGSPQRLNGGLVSQVDMGTRASDKNVRTGYLPVPLRELHIMSERKEEERAVTSSPPSPSMGSRRPFALFFLPNDFPCAPLFATQERRLLKGGCSPQALSRLTTFGTSEAAPTTRPS
jgi:hypothetical protein